MYRRMFSEVGFVLICHEPSFWHHITPKDFLAQHVISELKLMIWDILDLFGIATCENWMNSGLDIFRAQSHPKLARTIRWNAIAAPDWKPDLASCTWDNFFQYGSGGCKKRSLKIWDPDIDD